MKANLWHSLKQMQAGIGLGVLLALILAGCGFHLRQAQPLPFKTLFITGLAETSEMGAALRRNIRAQGGTTLVDKPEGAEAILAVVAEGRDKTILSLNSAGRVREFRLKQRIVFRVHDGKGKDFLPQNEVAIARDFSFSDNALLAKEQEEALLYRDMQNDLIQQMSRRLAAAKAEAVAPQ